MSSSRTMALTSSEWQALIVMGVAQLHARIATMTAAPSADESTELRGHLDRLKLQVAAWGVSNVKPVAQVAQPELALQAPAQQAANGSESAKRRGGWPKGKPRKPAQSSESTEATVQ